MTQSPIELKVLTFNLWGIFNSKMREDRMIHFASKIEHYDIILLQEQFDPDDFARMQALVPEHVRKTRYFRRFPSGFYGSGCAVISKYPITSAFFHIYPLQGYPEMVLHGDFFANKGAALVKVNVPMEVDGAIVNQELSLYTTHLVAVYQKVSQMSTWKKERYLPYRISQAMSLADFIVNTSKPTDYIIIGGDFNSSQRSLEVQMMLIMLKRKGYDLRSVLPTPGALLETARTEEQAEQARSMFTYSYRNSFNTSKTSYFKLLKLEADIPSQIDHIFFNAAAFTLKTFEDCPDANPAFPFEIDTTGEGNRVPTGVVVFTKNEVLRTQQPSWRERWSAALRTRSRNDPQSPVTVVANLLHRQAKGAALSPSANASQTFSADDAHHRHPISDHFGVACRLEMHPRVVCDSATTRSEDENWQHVSEPAGAAAVAAITTTTTAAAAAAGSVSIALTEEELLVVNNVEKFLGFFVRKLRYQVKVTRVMAGVSLGIIAINAWSLQRLANTQEQRTAAALRQLYQVAVNNSAAAGADTKRKQGTTAAEGNASLEAQVKEATVKIVGKTISVTKDLLNAVGVKVGRSSDSGPAAAANDKGTVTAPPAAAVAPDFLVLAQELCLRPVWATVGSTTFVTFAASIVSVGALAVGMFQRTGNANILAEQVRLIHQSTTGATAANNANTRKK